MTIRVLLVDDEELVRTGFRLILRDYADIEVVGEACDGEAGVRAARQLHPDVVLLDIRMPRMDGVTATRAIVQGQPDPPYVLVLTTFDLDEYVHGALVAGASGFLLKDLSAAHLADAVRTVARGDALIAPTATRRLLARYRRTRLPDPRLLARLSAREVDVLRCVVHGRTNLEIAADLGLAVPTVKSYIGRLMTDLDARDRVQLVILGYGMGLDVDDPGTRPTLGDHTGAPRSRGVFRPRTPEKPNLSL